MSENGIEGRRRSGPEQGDHRVNRQPLLFKDVLHTLKDVFSLDGLITPDVDNPTWR